MRPPSNHPGFTLLEVVLAVSLTLVLMAAILTFYQQAADVRRAAIDEVELVAAERLIMQRLTDELRSAKVYAFLGQGVEGSTGSVQFATLTVPSGAVWAIAKATESDPIPPERDLQIVGYQLRYSEDEYGDLQVDGLERTCQRILTPREAEKDEDGEQNEIEAVLLSSQIRFLQLAYWDGSAWIDGWGGDLPQAVEIRLGTEPLPEGTEPEAYPYPTFRRVVYLPSAPKVEAGAVIRGLRGGRGS